MKKFVYILLVFTILFFCGCVGISSSKAKKPEQPRRVFESVEIKDNLSSDPFIVNEFIKDGISYNKESVYFSTALFLSDLGILNEITKKQFENYASVIFSDFPKEGQVKQIIIPNLSRSNDESAEKNAYLFISKLKNQEGRSLYLLESNIPIAGVNNRPYYDGYIVKLDSSFYRNQVPARWTSIMFIYFVDNNLFYRGLAYPSKSAPLIITEKGIRSDTGMNESLSGQSTLADIKNKLKETVENIIKNTVPENQQQTDLLKFLEKNSNLSLSAYSYIDGNVNDAKKFYLLSEGVKVDIPDDAMGRRSSELRKIMDYLLKL